MFYTKPVAGYNTIIGKTGISHEQSAFRDCWAEVYRNTRNFSHVVRCSTKTIPNFYSQGRNQLICF